MMEFDTRTGVTGPKGSRSMRRMVLLFLVAFLAGIAAMGWGLTRWDGFRQWLFGPTTVVRPDAATTGNAARILAVPAPSLAGPDLAGRLAAVEARTARLEAAGTGAGGSNSARAEALLVTFAARRAIDRGLGLGYVEGLLTERFGATQPRSVALVIAASRNPVTLDQLRSGLDAVAPQLLGTGPDTGWWSEFKSGLAGIFVVRKAGTVSTDPQARVDRAENLVEEGRIEPALAEVARLPNRNLAARWIDMARRYVEAHQALDVLEAAALTTTRPTPPLQPDTAPAVQTP